MMRRLKGFRPEVLKQDRFLLAILFAIGLLVLTSLVLFFTRQADQDYLSEGTPRDIVYNYILALHRGDFERAYGYLAESSDKPDYEHFRLTILTLDQNLSQISLQVGDVRQNDDAASLGLTIVHTSGNPFQSAWEETGTAVLVRNEAGEWKIQSLPYPFWGIDWSDASPKSVP